MHEVSRQSLRVVHAWESPDFRAPFHAGGFAWVVVTALPPSAVEVSRASIRSVSDRSHGPQGGLSGGRRWAEKGVCFPRMASRQVVTCLDGVEHLAVLRLVQTVVAAQPAANFSTRWVKPCELLMGP